MTSNQINYWSLQEQQRANRRKEGLTQEQNEIARINAGVNERNATSNERNAASNESNAKTNRLGFWLNAAKTAIDVIRPGSMGDAVKLVGLLG